MSEQEEITRKNDLSLSVMHALIDHVTSNIRLVSIKVEKKKIDLYFIFDGEIASQDLQNAEEVKNKVQVDYPLDTVILHCLRIDAPERPRIGALGIFMRKELF
jgi:hypothetical protein